MPFLNEYDPLRQGPRAHPFVPEKETPAFFSETLPAAFSIDNTVGSYISNDVVLDSEVREEFDPMTFMPEGYEHYATAYALANTQEQVLAITQQIDKENSNRRTVDEAGFMGTLASFGAGVFDIINLAPVGGAAYASARIGNSFLQGALRTGAAGAAGATAAELLLHQDQYTRTTGESIFNIATATALSGVLGGSMSAVISGLNKSGAGKVAEIMDQVDKDLTHNGQGTGTGSMGAAGSADLAPHLVRDIETAVEAEVKAGKIAEADAQIVIAERVAEERLAQEGIKSSVPLQVVDKATLGVLTETNPNVRMLQSDVIETRTASQKLAEGAVVVKKNSDGTAAPENVERNVKNYDMNLRKVLVGLDEAYAKYSGTYGKTLQTSRAAVGAVVQKTMNKAGRRLTYKEFRERVAMSMRNGDADEIAEVAEAARHTRKELYDPIAKRAQELGLLDKDLDPVTAVSYLNRNYNTRKMADDPDGFVNNTTEWLLTKQADAEVRISNFASMERKLASGVKEGSEAFEALRAQIKEATDELEVKDLGKQAEALGKETNKLKKELETLRKQNDRDLDEVNLDRSDFEALAWEIHGRIVSTPDGRLPYDQNLVRVDENGGVPANAGKASKNANMQRRKFLIPDKMIADYLENDIELLASQYVRNMAPDIEIKRMFPLDDLNLTQTKKSIQDAWQKKSSTDGKWKDKMDGDIRDVTAMVERLRGNYGLPDNPMSWAYRTGRAMRQLNYIRLLGGMTFSAIPDLARLTMVHGITRAFGDVYLPLLTNFKQFAKMSTEVREMGLAMDMLTNSRAQSIAQITDPVLKGHSFPERALQGLADTMSNVSLMAPWNSAMKQMAAVGTMARVRRGLVAEGKGKISAKEAEYLRFLGIDEAMGRRIMKQMDEFGELSENGLPLPRWDKWTDADAKRLYQSAIGKETDRIIVTPGLDIPLWSNKSEVTRLISQFKSFALSSNNRVLVSGLQQADMAAASGFTLAIALGSMTAGIKMWDSGRGDELKDWDVNKFILEGIDRSGTTGWFFEANNMIERLTRGEYGLSALFGVGGTMSRYTSRNIAGALSGPSFGLVTTLAGISGSTATALSGTDRWKESDTRSVRRLLPYQNLLIMRQVFDQLEKGINSSLGVRK